MAKTIDAAVMKLSNTDPDALKAATEFSKQLIAELGLPALGGDGLPPIDKQETKTAAKTKTAEKPAAEKPVAEKPVEKPVEKPEAAADSDSDGAASSTKPAAARKRTVSKKMKEDFAAAGGNEAQLKEAMKAYKDASDDEAAVGWPTFSVRFRNGEAAEAAPATPPKKAAAKKAAPGAPKKEKAAKAHKAARENFIWTPAAKKLFAEATEAAGGKVTDLLKSEFAEYANNMAADDYKALATVGHMRAFLTERDQMPPLEKCQPAEAAADETADQAVAASAAEDDDEDMESFEFEAEELFIGVSSGKIYRQSESAGDVLIGVAGQGRFKDVKIPA
jgi:hypothetical protein